MLDVWAGDRFRLTSAVHHWGSPRIDIDFRLESVMMLALVETRYVADYGAVFDPGRVKTIVKVSRPGKGALADATANSLDDIREFLDRMEAGHGGFGDE